MSKDNDFWFPAKTFGWGWGLPVRWQGWLVLALYFLLLFVGIQHFRGRQDSSETARLYVLALTAVLIGITYIKGEKPGWRSGNK